jgi:hypothetical protein
MAKEKTGHKAFSKRLKKQETIIVIKTTLPAKDPLFPGKLKKANEMLKNVKLMDQDKW